jgi:predicted transcriptional regulator of viral defense system
VVSHESALALLDLSDVIPKAVHLTVPRSRRHLPTIPGVKVHTTTRPLGAGDVVERDGVRVASAARTILDAAGAGTAPEQVEVAVLQALDRGLMTRGGSRRTRGSGVDGYASWSLVRGNGWRGRRSARAS